ncbi:MAG: DMT family transporter [Granulosicoccus sp.]
MAINERSNVVGIALMLIVAIMGALDAVIVRLVTPSVHPFIIGFTRSFFGLLIVIPWVLAKPAILESSFRFRHLLRAILKLASLILFFMAYAAAPLADVTAIAFTAPIFVTLGAWTFLSERPQKIRVIAILVGFAGVLTVIQPGQQSGVPAGLLLALAAALLTAIFQLMLKPMSARDSTETLVAWNLLLTVPLAAIPAWLVWSMPTTTEWLLLATQGVLGMFAMSMVTKAFSLTEASLLAPIEFLRLPIVAGFAYLFFNQIPGVATLLGGTFIFAATMMMARSARPVPADKS